jgi:hypothetical protein
MVADRIATRDTLPYPVSSCITAEPTARRSDAPAGPRPVHRQLSTVHCPLSAVRCIDRRHHLIRRWDPDHPGIYSDYAGGIGAKMTQLQTFLLLCKISVLIGLFYALLALLLGVPPGVSLAIFLGLSGAGLATLLVICGAYYHAEP